MGTVGNKVEKEQQTKPAATISQRGSEEPAPKQKAPDKEKEELKRILEDERKKTEDYLKSLKYLQADLENLKKRTLIEISTASENAVQRLVVDLLTVLDELDLALREARARAENKAMVDGIERIRTNLFAILERQGLSKIEAIGKKFDSVRHSAAGKIATSILTEGTIIEEIRTGYIFRGQVIRPSVVRVSIPETKEKKEAAAIKSGST